MSVRNRLRTVLCCAILQFGALFGIPMRPEQIRELMYTLNQPKVAQTNPDSTVDGDVEPDAPDR